MRPKRFKIYTIAYVVSVLIFILNIFGSASASFLFLSFALTSFFLVFSIETLPKDNLEKPQVYFYEKSRLNSYTYSLLILFVTAALLYYILSGIFKLNSGLTIITIWPICIVASQFIYKITVPNLPFEIAYDYLRTTLRINPTYDEEKLIKALLRELLPILDTSPTEKELNTLEKEYLTEGLSNEFYEKTVETLKQYIALSNDKLTSQEVVQIEADKDSQ
ncbi:MAG: hypothetical protein ABI721_03875 [Candidatus Dojkabacteria bacterium]